MQFNSNFKVKKSQTLEIFLLMARLISAELATLTFNTELVVSFTFTVRFLNGVIWMSARFL